MTTTSFSTLQDFLAMGGYGAYVWSAYGITAVILIVQVMKARSASRKNKNPRGKPTGY